MNDNIFNATWKICVDTPPHICQEKIHAINRETFKVSTFIFAAIAIGLPSSNTGTAEHGSEQSTKPIISNFNHINHVSAHTSALIGRAVAGFSITVTLMALLYFAFINNYFKVICERKKSVTETPNSQQNKAISATYAT